MPTVKQALKVIMALNGKTQTSLADEMGVIREVLNRTINKPDHRIATDLLPIAQALGCTIRLQFVDKNGNVAASVDYPQE